MILAKGCCITKCEKVKGSECFLNALYIFLLSSTEALIVKNLLQNVMKYIAKPYEQNSKIKLCLKSKLYHTKNYHTFADNKVCLHIPWESSRVNFTFYTPTLARSGFSFPGLLESKYRAGKKLFDYGVLLRVLSKMLTYYNSNNNKIKNSTECWRRVASWLRVKKGDQ